jgi:hypothetical protein
MPRTLRAAECSSSCKSDAESWPQRRGLPTRIGREGISQTEFRTSASFRWVFRSQISNRSARCPRRTERSPFDPSASEWFAVQPVPIRRRARSRQEGGTISSARERRLRLYSSWRNPSCLTHGFAQKPGKEVAKQVAFGNHWPLAVLGAVPDWLRTAAEDGGPRFLRLTQ